MLSSTSFNRYRYGRRGKMGFGRCYYKTNFKNRRRQNKYRIIFNDFKQDNELKMNGFNCDEYNCGCKIVVINHTVVSYNFDTTIRDRINYNDTYRTLDMVARGLYYDDY